MPHVPIAAGENFAGTQPAGLYGDVIAEIDASVGSVMTALRETGNADRTLVIFTTDNGPWLSYGNHAGSAGPLREGKGTAWEGGVRVPTIVWMPGRIGADTTVEHMAATIDLLPTLCAITHSKLPTKPIDGIDISALLFEAEPTPVRQEYAYYYGRDLCAIREGQFKLVFPHTYRSLTGEPGQDGRPAGYSQQTCGLELYDLSSDIGEQHDLSEKYPEVVRTLSTDAEKYRTAFGDALTKQTGTEIRPAAKSDGVPLTDRPQLSPP